MTYGYLIAALILNAVANIFLKLGAVGAKGTSPLALAQNPYAVIGVLIFGLNVYVYALALRNFPVSLVYPLQVAAGFLIINTFGILVLKESYSALSIAGYAAIALGIFFLTCSYR